MATWTNTTKNSTTFTGITEGTTPSYAGLYIGFLSYTYANTGETVYPIPAWTNQAENSSTFNNQSKN